MGLGLDLAAHIPPTKEVPESIEKALCFQVQYSRHIKEKKYIKQNNYSLCFLSVQHCSVFYSSSTTKLCVQKLYSSLAVKTWQSVTSAPAKSVEKFPLTLQQQKFSTIPITCINSKLLLLTNDSQGMSVYKHMLFLGSLWKKIGAVSSRKFTQRHCQDQNGLVPITT